MKRQLELFYPQHYGNSKALFFSSTDI